MKKIILIFSLFILLVSMCEQVNAFTSRDTTVNPNVKVYRNVFIYEFFNDSSRSGIDAYEGTSVGGNNVFRDMELADSTALFRDRFYLRSGDGAYDPRNNPIGQETKFVPFFNARGVNSFQTMFDTVGSIYTDNGAPLVPADFFKYSTYSLGISFVISDVRIYGFWLKGKKLNLGLPYEVYGIMYIKAIDIVIVGGNPTYRLTMDIKINTHGENDFREHIVGIQNLSTEVISGYSLYQNYPNPFNPITKIKFDIPKNSYTKLTILDINGRELDKFEQHIEQGSYEYTWNASKFSSGMYFYKLETPEFSGTKKMLLLK